MNKSDVRSDLKDSTQKLLELISEFPEKFFNTKPNDGGWSAGEVAEHLIKLETGTVRLFIGEGTPCERNPEEKIGTMKKRLLQFEKKMTAPDSIVPDGKAKDKRKVLDKIQDIRQRLTGMIDIHDLSEVISDFDHPVFGTLTRIEWIYFSIYHSQRHGHQIDNIYQEVASQD